jgi:hypothetical protein
MSIHNNPGYQKLRGNIARDIGAAKRKRAVRNPCPHVSASDRALIAAAVAAGRVTHVPPVFCAPTRQAEMSR